MRPFNEFELSVIDKINGSFEKENPDKTKWNEFLIEAQKYGWNPQDEIEDKLLKGFFLVRQKENNPDDVAKLDNILQKGPQKKENAFLAFIHAIKDFIFGPDKNGTFPEEIDQLIVSFENYCTENEAEIKASATNELKDEPKKEGSGKEDLKDAEKDNHEEIHLVQGNDFGKQIDDIDLDMDEIDQLGEKQIIENNIGNGEKKIPEGEKNNEIKVNPEEEKNNEINTNPEKQKEDENSISMEEALKQKFGKEFKIITKNAAGGYTLGGKKNLSYLEKLTREDSFEPEEMKALPARIRGVAYIAAYNAWKDQRLDDLKKYAKMLKNAEEKPSVTRTIQDIQDGWPVDYVQFKEAMHEFYDKLNDENASMDSVRKAFDGFRMRAMAYEGHHREFLHSHKNSMTAERYRVIAGIADLSDAHMDLLDEIREGLFKSYEDVTGVKAREVGSRTLYIIESGIDDFVNPKANGGKFKDEDLDGFYKDRIREMATNTYFWDMESSAEQKMIYDRYARKNGLKTEEAREELQPLSGSHTQEEFAKNYLSIKYRDEIKDMFENGSEEDRIKNLIDINEKIRQRTFKKEMEALSGDFYFRRIVLKNPENWVERWKSVEENTEEWLKNAKDKLISLQDNTNMITRAGDMLSKLEAVNKKYNLTSKTDVDKLAKEAKDELIDAHKPLAEDLLTLALYRNKDRSILHAFVEGNQQLRDYIVRDVAEYIVNRQPFFIDSPHVQLSYERMLENKDYVNTIMHRIENCYVDVIIPKMNKLEQKGLIKQDGIKDHAKPENKNQGKAISENNEGFVKNQKPGGMKPGF